MFLLVTFLSEANESLQVVGNDWDSVSYKYSQAGSGVDWPMREGVAGKYESGRSTSDFNLNNSGPVSLISPSRSHLFSLGERRLVLVLISCPQSEFLGEVRGSWRRGAERPTAQHHEVSQLTISQ
jgi:hypothetical protein